MLRHLALALAVCLVACTEEVRDLDDDGDGCFGGCVEPPPPSDRLTIEGRVCARTSPVPTPHKLLLVLDRSGSWQFSDPGNTHFQAVTDLLNGYMGHPDAQVGLISFNGGLEITEFTNDRTTLESALANSVASGQSDLQGALATALRVLEQDMVYASQGALVRSTYEIILIGEGTPDPICQAGCDNDSSCWGYCDGLVEPELIEGLFVDLTPCGAYNTDEQILGYADAIAALGETYGVDALRLHTMYFYSEPDAYLPPMCSGIPETDSEVGGALYAQIAEHGGGEALSLNVAEDLVLPAVEVHPDETLYVTRALAILHAWNLSSGPDSDGDGLLDGEERTAGTDPLALDTDGDGFRDLLEQRLSTDGWDPLDPALPALECEDPVDSEGDRLTDCEEAFLGTDWRVFDSDFDLIADGEEIARGTDPLRDDMALDADLDGLNNGQEIATGMNPRVPDAERWADVANRILVQEQGEGCYELVVENVDLATTEGLSPDEVGWNTILVQMVEEDPGVPPPEYTQPRAACVRARLLDGVRDPASGTVTLTDEDFHPLEELRLSLDCVGP